MKLCGIEMDSVVDGPGIRMTVFFQGCPHHCEGCHNPETWDYDAECMEMSVAEVLKLFDGDSILTGLTLSGGEPLSPRNFEEIFELVQEMKKRNTSTINTEVTTEDKVLTLSTCLNDDDIRIVVHAKLIKQQTK